MVIKIELDDHGHATLLVHGDPEIIQDLAKIVTLMLAAEADGIALVGGDELGLESAEDDDEDLASSS